ncbi:MAG: class I SAM-dependent methyltransferase [Patescibacteria group bacterium]
MQIDILALYRKYQAELAELSERLLPMFHAMQRCGYLTTFGDIEGEVLYMLIREQRPKLLFEISPNAGWSTNYLLGALTKNGEGTLHSFDILMHMSGRPMESVIRGNQCEKWDQKRLHVHIGDAREKVEEVSGAIDFLLIDSCHTDWFAEWYTTKLFPRVQGMIAIQDIMFWDRKESSSEARFIEDFLHQKRIAYTMIGMLEREVRATTLRDTFAERRGLRSNTLLLEYPPIPAVLEQKRAEGPDEFLKAAALSLRSDSISTLSLLNRAVNTVMYDGTRVNRHRILMKAAELYGKLGDCSEARRCAQRAFGIAMTADFQQRKKVMAELLLLYLRQGRLLMALRLKLLILLEPQSWIWVCRSFGRFLRDLASRSA